MSISLNLYTPNAAVGVAVVSTYTAAAVTDATGAYKANVTGGPAGQKQVVTAGTQASLDSTKFFWTGGDVNKASLFQPFALMNPSRSRR